MSSKPHSQQTLESLISQYRRTNIQHGEAELEIRFKGVDSFIAETILKSLVDKEIPVEDGQISQTVNSIMNEKFTTKGSRKGANRRYQNQKANLIRQIIFTNGKKTGEKNYRKWQLAQPFKVRNLHALDYTLNLYGEQDLTGTFSSDSNAIIRVKCRVSFKVKEKNWRIDLTVIKQLSGSDAQTGLSKIVSEMFKPKMTPANMLELLGVTDPDSEYRNLYSYELEIEHIPGNEIRPSNVTSVVNDVLCLINPKYMEDAVFQSEIFHIAGFIIDAPGLLRRFEYEWGLKKLTPSVTALTRNDYKSIYPPTGYYLLDKADGIRAVVSIRDGTLKILADKLIEITNNISMKKIDHSLIKNTIVDGELINKKDGKPTIYIFDVMVIAGENVSSDGYEDRIKHLDAASEIINKFDFNVEVKPIVHLTASESDSLKVQFNSPEFDNRPYKIDGRILVEPGKSYRDTIAYKWKPLQNNTIDVLARRAPSSILGRSPYIDFPGHELYLLFVGINPDLYHALGLERIPGYSELFPSRSSGSYFPIQFSPSDSPMAYLYQHPKNGDEIDGKVIEIRCAGECIAAGNLEVPDWEFVGIRHDREREIKTQKYFGNDFRIAELTWLNYIDPFKEEQLWNGPSSEYFAVSKSAIYRAQTAFTSFVKSRRIESDLPHVKWVIDAAIGKGQDYGRYLKAGVKNLIGIDQDQGALSELIRRKYINAKPKKGKRESTKLFILKADLTTPHDQLTKKVHSISEFPEGGVDGIVINLAIHYLANNVKNLRNFVAFANKLIKPGGIIIITAMFGEKVNNLISENNISIGQSWDIRQNEVLKYSIRRDYSENSLTKAGQKIGVLLPFSNGEYYEEYLVNVDAIVKEFSNRKFKLIETPTFDTYFEEFHTRNPTMYKMLNEDDFKFLSLYGEIILRKE